MLFWIITGLLALFVVFTLASGLLRRTTQEVDGSDVALYKDQLAEVERDLERGTLDVDEADRSRLEISHRLLAADAAAEINVVASPITASRVLTTVAAVAVLGLTFGGYAILGAPGYSDLPLKARLGASQQMRNTRPSQAALEANAPVAPPVDAPTEYLESVAQLRLVMQDRPDDLQGYQLLAQHESRLGNYAQAAAAAGAIVRIKGNDANISDKLAYADRAVAAAIGIVSPEVEAVLHDIRRTDPNNIGARYYLGLLYAQTDRADLAFRLWQPIVAQGAPTAYLTFARAQIEEAAFRAGLDYTLPVTRGPDLQTMQDAEGLSDAYRQEMIQGMVTSLSDRLVTQGGTAQEWAQLIVAHGVLGNATAAAEIYAESQSTFAASPDDLAILQNAAQRAGVVQ
jgi:cytochrome c-type biogenesis protein CcmH